MAEQADILDSYQELRQQLMDLAKEIYKLLTENDKLGMIKSRGITKLIITPNRLDDQCVTIEFFSAKEGVALFSVDFSREVVLNLDEDELVKQWLVESIKLIELHNLSVCRRFLKAFTYADYNPIHAIISNYSNWLDKSDEEIAKIVASHITKLYMEKMKS